MRRARSAAFGRLRRMLSVGECAVVGLARAGLRLVGMDVGL